MSHPSAVPQSPYEEGDLPRGGVLAPERITAFTDAVVAIAMTLLILPLMEAASDAATANLHAEAWLGQHGGQLMSFLLSFLLVAVYWLEHNSVFAAVRGYTRRMVWVNVLWLLTIVWLPVPTSLIGTMHLRDGGAYDRVLVALYVGSLILNSIALAVLQVLILRTPAVWPDPAHPPHHSLSASIAAIILSSLALAVALLVPEVSLWALLLLGLIAPLSAVLRRRFGRRRVRDAARNVE